MEQAVETRITQYLQPDYRVAWEMVAGQLRMEMSRAIYETWVHSLQPLGFQEGVYRIGATNSYVRDWVESRLYSRIALQLEAIFHQPVKVTFGLIASEEREAAAASSGARSTRIRAAAEKEPAVKEASALEAGEADPFASETGGVGGPSTGDTAGESAGSGDAEAILDRVPLKPARRKKNSTQAGFSAVDEGGSPRKIQLQRAYGTERARVIQPERGMFLTMYFLNNWLPLLGGSAAWTVIASRSLCYWNPMTGELRNTVETDMAELARRASVSVRTVKDVLNQDLIKRYFLRYKVRRVMTPNGVRTAGIILQVRMDDPLTPEDQDRNSLLEEEHWYTVDFEDETEE